VAWRDAIASSGVESAPALCETAVRALAAGKAIRATGRLGPMDQNTGGEWRHRAALHGRSVAWDFSNPATTSVTSVGTLADLILYAPTRTVLIAVWRGTCVPAAVESVGDTPPMTPEA
jgi:hypothetical protein